jgi:hypothetical protein
MDVDTLRNELEEHLKNNPDEHAPSGFRDRFEATVEDIEAAESEECRAELEAQLRQIRVEAEVAVKCACGEGEEAGDAPAPTASRDEEVAEAPAAEAPPEAAVDEPAAMAGPPAVAPEIAEAKIDDSGPAEPIDDVREDPGQGLMQRYGILIVVVLIVVVAAVYYLRG